MKITFRKHLETLNILFYFKKTKYLIKQKFYFQKCLTLTFRMHQIWHKKADLLCIFISESLTKHIACLQWTANTLPNDFVVAFTSDDVIIDIGLLRDHVDKHLTTVKPPDRLFVANNGDGSSVVTNQRQSVYCFDKYREKDKVNRNANKEQFVSK